MCADILLRGKAVASDGLTELYVASEGNIILCFCAGKGDQTGVFQMNEVAFTHVFFGCVDADNLAEKHMVASKRQDLLQFAFDVQRALHNNRGVVQVRRLPSGEPGELPFIGAVFCTDNATLIRGSCQLFRIEIKTNSPDSRIMS